MSVSSTFYGRDKFYSHLHQCKSRVMPLKPVEFFWIYTGLIEQIQALLPFLKVVGRCVPHHTEDHCFDTRACVSF